jgi:hypothetical protein
VFRKRKATLKPSKMAKLTTPEIMDATESAIMSAGHLYDSARLQRSEWHLDLLRGQLEQALLGVEELLQRG